MFRTNKIFTAFFFLALFFIPFQLGKHFWPSFAYVNGARIDYLSPTLYLSDISILFLLIFSFLLKKIKFEKFAFLGILGIMLYFSVNIFFSYSPFNGWYSLFKIIEMTLFACVVKKEITQRKILLFWAFYSGVVVEGALALLQFFHQSSVGGMWYFLGERTFSSTTPGIANASIRGQLVLRPYATFSHPNVFAGFLVIALLFILIQYFSMKNYSQKVLSILLIIFGAGILFLTLSRVAIVTFVVLATALIFIKIKTIKARVMLVMVYVLLVIVLGSSIFAGRFLDISSYGESLSLRDLLAQIALQMFFKHPVLGVGLGNFLPLLPHFAQGLPKGYSFLQPVHNIFLLVLTETGIIGFIIYLWVFLKAFVVSLKTWRKSKDELFLFTFVSLIAICVIGMTDHYFLTLQQGQLLLALVLGMSLGTPKLLKSHK